MVTTTLVLGATGATGRLLVKQLIEKEQKVKVIVRSRDKFMQCLQDCKTDEGNLTIIEGTILDMSDDDAKKCIKDCNSIVSCLGHNMTMKGMFGHPRKLVTDSIKRVCDIISDLDSHLYTKIILMGTDGAANPDGSDDIRSFGDRMIIGILRMLLPPVVDNEEAAKYLSQSVGKDSPKINWVIVRPSDLIDGEVSEYEIIPKPNCSLFGAAQTTRANVAAFMCELVLNEEYWKQWVFKLPVILNVEKENVTTSE